jgi:hypothetical protein
MKLVRFFLCLFLVFPCVCLGEETFCGKIEKFFFPGPDWKPGDEKYEAIMLRFAKKKTIRYVLLDDEQTVSNIFVSRIQIIPSLDGENGEMDFSTLLSLVGKHVCVSGEAMQSHTAHHVPPVILWGPKLIGSS